MANSASGLISFWIIDRVSVFGFTAQREGTSTIIWRSSLLIVVLPEKESWDAPAAHRLIFERLSESVNFRCAAGKNCSRESFGITPTWVLSVDPRSNLPPDSSNFLRVVRPALPKVRVKACSHTGYQRCGLEKNKYEIKLIYTYHISCKIFKASSERVSSLKFGEIDLISCSTADILASLSLFSVPQFVSFDGSYAGYTMLDI